MRVVVDTNVLVAGLLNPRGRPGRIVQLLVLGSFAALVDDRILAEYFEVLRRPAFGFSPANVTSLLEFLDAASERVQAFALPALPDPGDQPFLEVAVTGHADALVTGNLRHFPAKVLPASLRVERPADFLRRLTSSLDSPARDQ